MQLTIKLLNYRSIKVKLKIMHTLKEIELCQFSTTITHNKHFFPTVLFSLLINSTKLAKQTGLDLQKCK